MEFMKIKNKKTRQNWEDNSVGLKEKKALGQITKITHILSLIYQFSLLNFIYIYNINHKLYPNVKLGLLLTSK